MQTQRTDLWAQWGKERVGWIKRISLKYYILPCVKIDSGKFSYNAGSLVWCFVMTWRGGMGMGGRQLQEGGDTCILMVDSFCLTAETSTTL